MSEKNKILVTGAAGFVGSWLTEKLADNKNNTVVAVDNFLTGQAKNLDLNRHANLKFIKADANDFNDLASIFYAYQFDYVFHYAAVVGVKRTLDNPVMVLNDLQGIRNVLNLSKNTGVSRVYFSSSSEVYGEPVEFPQNEHTTPLNSRLPYAIVKNVGEAYLRSYKQEFDLDFTIFRFFNTYGPRQSVDFVMSKFIAAALKGKDIVIYGDGMQTRTFCYIEDNIEACTNAFYQNKFINDVINVGSDNEITILELANIIIKLTNSKSKIVHTHALKEGDMTRRKPDNSKMKELVRRPMTSLEQGIQLLIKSGMFK